MSDESLVRDWTASSGADAEAVRKAIEAAVAADRADRRHGRVTHAASIACAVLLWPILLYSAAKGVTPVVRAGYALMATGVTVMLFAEFAYASWDVRSRPGPVDALAQCHVTMAMLTRQAALMRYSAAWAAPIFVGTALIGWWTYTERSHAFAMLLWAGLAVAWVMSARAGVATARDLEARHDHLRGVLDQLR